MPAKSSTQDRSRDNEPACGASSSPPPLRPRIPQTVEERISLSPIHPIKQRSNGNTEEGWSRDGGVVNPPHQPARCPFGNEGNEVEGGEEGSLDVPTSLINTEFSDSSADSNYATPSSSFEDFEETKERERRRARKALRRKRDKLRCLIKLCRDLKRENKKLRGGLTRQHKELNGYRSMHSSLASMPNDLPLPPLSARGCDSSSHSRTGSNVRDGFGGGGTPPLAIQAAAPVVEVQCLAQITSSTAKQGAQEQKMTLAALINNSFSNVPPTTTDAVVAPASATSIQLEGVEKGAAVGSSPPQQPPTQEQRLLDQINGIGASATDGGVTGCILLLRHLLFRAMMQCRAGEAVIRELERERRGAAITVLRYKQENAALCHERDAAAAVRDVAGGSENGIVAETPTDVKLSAALAGNSLEGHRESTDRVPSKGKQVTLSKKRLSCDHEVLRQLSDSSAVSPVGGGHSGAGASVGYGLSNSHFAGDGRRASSSAHTGAVGGGSFVRSVSADRSVASSNRLGTDRPGTPASTSVGFRKSRPAVVVGGGSARNDSFQRDAITSAEQSPTTSPLDPAAATMTAAAVMSRQNDPVVPPLRRLATTPVAHLLRSPRGPSNPTGAVGKAVMPSPTLSSGRPQTVRTPVSASSRRMSARTSPSPAQRSLSAAQKATNAVTLNAPRRSMGGGPQSRTNSPTVRPQQTRPLQTSASTTASPKSASKRSITANPGGQSTTTASSAQDRQRAMLSRSPVHATRGATPSTPSRRTTIPGGVVPRQSVVIGAKPTAQPPLLSTAGGSTSNIRKLLASSPCRKL